MTSLRLEPEGVLVGKQVHLNAVAALAAPVALALGGLLVGVAVSSTVEKSSSASWALRVRRLRDLFSPGMNSPTAAD